MKSFFQMAKIVNRVNKITEHFIWKTTVEDVGNFVNYVLNITSSFCFHYIIVYVLDQACDPTQRADVAAVVMQEGLANLVLVTPAMTLLRAKVEVTIPRKRKGSCTQHDKVKVIYRQLISC